MIVLSFVEKGWAAARWLSIGLAKEGYQVKHLVRGKISRDVLLAITPHRNIRITSTSTRFFRSAAWATLMLSTLTKKPAIILSDNEKTADWISQNFKGFRNKVVLLKDSARGGCLIHHCPPGVSLPAQLLGPRS